MGVIEMENGFVDVVVYAAASSGLLILNPQPKRTLNARASVCVSSQINANCTDKLDGSLKRTFQTEGKWTNFSIRMVGTAIADDDFQVIKLHNFQFGHLHQTLPTPPTLVTLHYFNKCGQSSWPSFMRHVKTSLGRQAAKKGKGRRTGAAGWWSGCTKRESPPKTHQSFIYLKVLSKNKSFCCAQRK